MKIFYKILHKLFGFDYIAVNNYPQGYKILRLQVTANNYPYYLGANGNIVLIVESEKYIWLTCRPEKYFGENDIINRLARQRGKNETI